MKKSQIIIFRKTVELYDEEGDKIIEGCSFYESEGEKKEAIELAIKYCYLYEIIDNVKNTDTVDTILKKETSYYWVLQLLGILIFIFYFLSSLTNVELPFYSIYVGIMLFVAYHLKIKKDSIAL